LELIKLIEYYFTIRHKQPKLSGYAYTRKSLKFSLICVLNCPESLHRYDECP